MAELPLHLRGEIVATLQAIPEVSTFVATALTTNVFFATGDEPGSILPSIRCSFIDTVPFVRDAPMYLASVIQVDCFGTVPNDTVTVAAAIYRWFAVNGETGIFGTNVYLSGMFPLAYVRQGVAVAPDSRGVYASTITLQVMWRDDS